jgi:hypothetical protein
VYEISRAFAVGPDPRAIERSGLFGPEERAQLDWIARDPSIRQSLEEYATQRAQLEQMEKEQVYMYRDGNEGTHERREAYLAAINMQEGLNAVTTNVLGAIGGKVGGRRTRNFFHGSRG